MLRRAVKKETKTVKREIEKLAKSREGENVR
jgi:hypothetical protein